jgi:hypothetical protein
VIFYLVYIQKEKTVATRGQRIAAALAASFISPFTRVCTLNIIY